MPVTGDDLDAVRTSGFVRTMFRFASRVLPLVLVPALGCAGADDPAAAPPVVDSAVANDSASDVKVEDTASADTTVVDSAVADSANDAPASETKPDAAPEASDTGGKARGQCFTNAHCGAGATCQPDAPGGICNGCGIDPSKCPASFDTCGTFGSCTRACSDDSVCMPGTTCLTGSGVCALKSCTGAGDCPATHACRAISADGATFCRRVLCPLGSECPTGTTCRDTGLTPAKVCVEDALFFGP